MTSRITVNAESEVTRAYNKAAVSYGVGYGHDIPSGAVDLYVKDLEDHLGKPDHRKALDFGCGTGLLTGVLAMSGYEVTGVDASKQMLSKARKKHPHVRFKLCNPTKLGALFAERSFDLVICRQVVGHFKAPIAVFEEWHHWLAPDGKVAVIDGLWTRWDWRDKAWRKFPDEFPLSCTQTWATVRYMLQLAGFSNLRGAWLHRVNGFESVRAVEMGERPVIRYIVVGDKT